jgi:hypothetical protein
LFPFGSLLDWAREKGESPRIGHPKKGRNLHDLHTYKRMALALLPVPKKNGVVRFATFLKRANSHGLDNLKKKGKNQNLNQNSF